MRGFLVIALSVILSVAIPSTCFAYTAFSGFTGNTIIGGIEATKKLNGDSSDTQDYLLLIYESGECLGFILGTIQADAASGDRKICLPDGVETNQLMAVIEKHLRAHPENWNQPATYQVWAALMFSFPCKKKE